MSSDGGSPLLKGLSAFLVLLSTVEIIVGSIAFVFVLNCNIGAFWAGAWGFLTGCAGLGAMSRPILQCATVMASICVCVGLVGVILDGVGAGFFTILTTCVQVKNLTATLSASSKGDVAVWGSQAGPDQTAAGLCAYSYIFENPLVPSYPLPSTCYCVYNGGCNGISNSYCSTLAAPSVGYACYYPFRLNYPSKYNCGDMMGGPSVYYVQVLSASCAVCALIVLTSFGMAVAGCMGVCGK